jgi:hypothetical protein
MVFFGAVLAFPLLNEHNSHRLQALVSRLNGSLQQKQWKF